MNKEDLNEYDLNKIIDVKSIASKEKKLLKKRISALKKSFNVSPSLATILIGEDPGSVYYLKMQKKNLEKLNCGSIDFKLGKDTSEDEIISLIKDLNSDEKVHGIMVLKPLPKGLDDEKISTAINPEKDIDGITPYNIGLLASFNKGIVPNTVRSVHRIIKSLDIDLSGKEAVIIGRSNVLGKPLAQKLLFEDMTITICHSKTQNLRQVVKRGDFVVSAVGKAEFIDKTYIKDGAALIDVGTTMVSGKCKGDFDFKSVIENASFITKVPGGVGTLTTTMLINNLVQAAEHLENNK